MSEIIYYLYRMIPAVALGAAVYLLSRPVRLGRLRRLGCGTSPGHEVGLLLFLVMTAGLLWLTVLPEILWENGHLVFREEGLGGINLKPFTIFWQSRILASQGFENYFLINFWGNIAMFLPIGFFPPLLWRRARWWQVVPAGCLLSLAIELMQIPIHRGTDVDDLWLNTLGTLVGYFLARGLGYAAPRFWEYCKIRRVDDGRQAGGRCAAQ